VTNIVVVLGSPRRKGNSATLAENVVLGAKSVGAIVETYYLHGMDIKPCDACAVCHKDTNAECVINDDMQKLYPKLRQADAIVIASPIYWFTVSAQTKLFMDRCYALGNSGGYALKGKRIGIVLTYEDSDPFVSGAVNAIRTFQDVFAYVGASIVGMVYGRASEPGDIANNIDLMNKAFELGKQLVIGIPE
jgi:multimeric flavodoxin WrbA